MRHLYAEQVNKILEDYYFNLENNPRGQEVYFTVLANGIRHLHGLAFCSNDSETTEALCPLVTAVLNGEVPCSLFSEAAT